MERRPDDSNNGVRTTELGACDEVTAFSVVDEVRTQHRHQPAARPDVFQQRLQLQTDAEVIVSENVSIRRQFHVEPASCDFVVIVLDVQKYFVVKDARIFAILRH